ncbi:MAG: hypothetical protein DME98_07045 [Verrucomicrobia bacterium]|nr:MAG: hypothetical protein DME98_07045 [Verrucomicrobiota bacterium]PYJ32360.1 MAG: hypothetical protein DME88_11335 [Verrucomicrobiota bacterium]
MLSAGLPATTGWQPVLPDTRDARVPQNCFASAACVKSAIPDRVSAQIPIIPDHELLRVIGRGLTARFGWRGRSLAFRVKPESQIRKKKGSAFRIDTKWTILPRHFCQQSLNSIHIRSTETDFT